MNKSLNSLRLEVDKEEVAKLGTSGFCRLPDGIT